MSRTLSEDELGLLDGLVLKAQQSPLTLEQQAAITSGQAKASSFTTPLKLADNLWIAVTVENRESGPPSWHISVSLRGQIPPDDLLRLIAARLGLAVYTIAPDPRYGPLVRHIFSTKTG